MALSEEKSKRIVELFLDGKSKKFISESIGCAYNTVRSVIRKAGITRKSKKIKKDVPGIELIIKHLEKLYKTLCNYEKKIKMS